MSAIIIETKSKSDLKILKELAKKLGGNVLNIAQEDFEDFALGKIMDEEKTGQNISREKIFKALKAK